MKIAALLSTKGGPGKTTVTASLGAFCADSGLRTLLIDLDNQPSLSSFYALTHEAPGGAYELIANNETRGDQIKALQYSPDLQSRIASSCTHFQTHCDPGPAQPCELNARPAGR